MHDRRAGFDSNGLTHKVSQTGHVWHPLTSSKPSVDEFRTESGTKKVTDYGARNRLWAHLRPHWFLKRVGPIGQVLLGSCGKGFLEHMTVVTSWQQRSIDDLNEGPAGLLVAEARVSRDPLRDSRGEVFHCGLGKRAISLCLPGLKKFVDL